MKRARILHPSERVGTGPVSLARCTNWDSTAQACPSCSPDVYARHHAKHRRALEVVR